MGQGDVMNTLKEDEWKTTKQIAKELGCSSKSVNCCARAMLKSNEILRKEIKIGNHWGYQYKLK